MGENRPYHHGDLRAALIQAGFDLLAEAGLPGFSVAALARKLGVSTAAPYRHFPDRDHLLAAVAASAARELAVQVRAAVTAAGVDPVDRFTATTATFVRFAVLRGAGFNVIFSGGLEKLHDRELAEAGRDLMDELLAVTMAADDNPIRDSLELVQQQIALAHGYATLFVSGFFRTDRSLDDIAGKAARASRKLLAG